MGIIDVWQSAIIPQGASDTHDDVDVIIVFVKCRNYSLNALITLWEQSVTPADLITAASSKVMVSQARLAESREYRWKFDWNHCYALLILLLRILTIGHRVEWLKLNLSILVWMDHSNNLPSQTLTNISVRSDVLRTSETAYWNREKEKRERKRYCCLTYSTVINAYLSFLKSLGFPRAAEAIVLFDR